MAKVKKLVSQMRWIIARVPLRTPTGHEPFSRTIRPVSRTKTNTARIRNCHASATSQRKRG